MSGAAPLRFLSLVVGGWICARAAILVLAGDGAAPAIAVPAEAAGLAARASAADAPPRPPPAGGAGARPRFAARAAPFRFGPRPGVPPVTDRVAPPFRALPSGATPAGPVPIVSLTPPVPRSDRPASSRWSASAWAFVRPGGGRSLASGGTLGGSQIGGRIGYRLNADRARPLSLVARAYAPLQGDGAEVALGIEWQPVAALPVRLLAERRQALGRDGRSAFALLAYGGVAARPVAGPVSLDAYAQAGLVGLRARDMFVDGSLALTAPVAGRVRAGAAIWGAAQPGVSRLDAGPQLSLPLAIGGADFRLSAEWRVRIAGDAAPRSGPALTLAADF